MRTPDLPYSGLVGNPCREPVGASKEKKIKDRLLASQTNLVRAAGVLAALGGISWAANVLFGERGGGGGEITALLSTIPLMFAAGLAGLYLRYGVDSSPGKAGLGQGFAGLALLAGGFVIDAAGYGAGRQVLSFGLVIFALGLVLLGFSYLKDEPMPRLNYLPFGVGVLIPISLVLAPVESLGLAASALFGVGWVLLGAILFADAGDRDSQEKS